MRLGGIAFALFAAGAFASACGENLGEAAGRSRCRGRGWRFRRARHRRLVGPLPDGGETFAWEANDTMGWTISKVLGDETTDCCSCVPSPCSAAQASACDNTVMSAEGSVVTFSSGPALGGSHRYDGIYAVRSDVSDPRTPATPTVDLVLSAQHLSSQCKSDVHAVTDKADFVRVAASPP